MQSGDRVEAIPISHGIPDYLNLGLILDLPGGKVFHSGDLALLPVFMFKPLESAPLPADFFFDALDVAAAEGFDFTA